MAGTRKGGGHYPSSPHPAKQGGMKAAHVQQPKKSGTPNRSETTPQTNCDNLCHSIKAPGSGTRADGTTSRTPGTIC